MNYIRFKEFQNYTINYGATQKHKKTMTQNNTNTDVILSLDAATKTGWAIYQNGKITNHGTKVLDNEFPEMSYQHWLFDMIDKYKVTKIVAEDIFRDASHLKDTAYQFLSRIKGVLICTANIEGIFPVFINPLRVKSHLFPVIGYRRYTRKEYKQKMINRVNALGYTLEKPKADDEADAIGVMIAYLETHDFPVEHPKKR